MKIVIISCIIFVSWVIGFFVGYKSAQGTKIVRINPIQDGLTHHFYAQKINPHWRIHGYKKFHTSEEIKEFNKKLEKNGIKRIDHEKDMVGNNSVCIIDLDGVEFWYGNGKIDIYIDGEQLKEN